MGGSGERVSGQLPAVRQQGKHGTAEPAPHPCTHVAPPCSYSPHILEMRVTDSLPARRAKLYYLRDRKMNRI